jgi:hypothetical protein
VTWNQRDFPVDHLAEHGVEVLDPDRYLHRLLARFPDALLAELRAPTEG